MTAGTHTVVMEYYENGGGAVARLSWSTGASALVAASAVTGSGGGTGPAVATTVPTATWCPTGRFLAEYFATPEPVGTPVRTECVAEEIGWRWAAGAPAGLPSDGFSVRLTGRFTVATTGKQRFRWSADDGVRIYLDGRRIVDRWWAPSAGSVTQTVRAGTRMVQLEFVERTGDAAVSFSWR